MGKILPVLAQGPAVDMTEQLPDTAVGATVTEEGVVVKDDCLSVYADAHLLGDMLESIQTCACVRERSGRHHLECTDRCLVTHLEIF